MSRIADGGGIEQPDGSFLHQRIHPPDPQQPFRILYTGRSQPLDVAARCLQFRSPGSSYCTLRGRQRYGGAKRQELRAALVAFVTIGKCDDRTRAVMGDKAEEVRADCRNL
jgi:hypothetical protein